MRLLLINKINFNVHFGNDEKQNELPKVTINPIYTERSDKIENQLNNNDDEFNVNPLTWDDFGDNQIKSQSQEEPKVNEQEEIQIAEEDLEAKDYDFNDLYNPYDNKDSSAKTYKFASRLTKPRKSAYVRRSVDLKNRKNKPIINPFEN